MGVIHRYSGSDGGWDWEGVPVQDYGPARPNVTVRRFISRADGSDNLEVRYFELGPGASSNHEIHNFEHAVLILRGHGTVRLGSDVHPVSFGDAVFVAAGEEHQFRAAEDGILGFLCAVLDPDLRATVHGEQRHTLFN